MVASPRGTMMRVKYFCLFWDSTFFRISGQCVGIRGRGCTSPELGLTLHTARSLLSFWSPF